MGLVAAGALLLAGCGAEPSAGEATPTVTISPTTTAAPTATGMPSNPVTLPTATTGAPVTVTGIPERGVEASCLLLDKYLLIGGDRALLSSGVSVTVTGHTESDVMSFCQQGIYLVVDSVTRAG